MHVLITGGTGTLGKAIAKQLKADRVRIFSRNELNQVRMKREFPDCEYIIGDVRDYKVVKEASRGVDVVFHTASMKHVPVCEAQPFEALKTNVYGAANVIKAAKRNGCVVVNISTDKANDPYSFYGMTKLMAERLMEQAGFISYRSGNIFGSSGSVIPMFIDQVQKNNAITLTNANMTRFWVLADVLAGHLIRLARGDNQPLVLKSFTMDQIARAVKRLYGNANTEIKIIGERPGEKIHEFLDGESSANCVGKDEDLIKMFHLWGLYSTLDVM